MIDLANTLPGLMKNLPSGDEVRGAVVFAVWKTAAGPELARRAVPVEFADGLLVIAVPDEAWRRNLESLSGQLLYKLNSAFDRPAVRRIEFTVDEAAVSIRADAGSANVAEKSAKAALKNVPQEVKRAAAAIEDKALRRAFLLAAGGCLGRAK